MYVIHKITQDYCIKINSTLQKFKKRIYIKLRGLFLIKLFLAYPIALWNRNYVRTANFSH